jgi:endonuclease I
MPLRRIRVSPGRTTLLKRVWKTDLYSMELLHADFSSTIEHIIPWSYLPQHLRRDPHNLAIVHYKLNQRRKDYGFRTNMALSSLFEIDDAHRKIVLHPSHPSLGRIARSSAYVISKCTVRKEKDKILHEIVDIRSLNTWNSSHPPTSHELHMHNCLVANGAPVNPFVLGQVPIKDCRL